MDIHEMMTPSVLKVDAKSPYHSRVVLEPLERGYGHTLGNALRRILLSSMPGYAITEVAIDGVLHEYSTIEGVQEDVVDILLNLKQVAIKLTTGNEAFLTLSKEGPCQVTAGDIQLTHGQEIINPELVIATLNENGKLNMTLKIEKGVGFHSTDSFIRNFDDEIEHKSVGKLKVDNSFLLSKKWLISLTALVLKTELTSIS